MLHLKDARKNAGFTQGQVGEIIGVTQSTYSYWESGRTKIDAESLKKLAALFNVSTDYLLGRDEPTQTIDEQLSEIDFALSGELRNLSDDEKKDVLDYMRFKRAQRKG